MSFGLNTSSFDGDDIARPRPFRKRIDKSTPPADDDSDRAAVLDDTDIVHVVDESSTLIDTSTGEILWGVDDGAGRGHDIEVENDETHLSNHQAGDEGRLQPRVQMLNNKNPELNRSEVVAAEPFDGGTAVVFDDTDIVHALGGDSIYSNNMGGGLLGVADDGSSAQPVGVEVEGLDDLNL